MSISIHFEQILTNLSTYEPRKLVHLLVPYTYAVNTSGDNAAQTYNGCPTEMSPEEKTAWLAQFPHVRLIAMHVIASTIRFMSSSEILDEVNSLATAILPSLASPLVDIRKAVIVILVEVYTTIGDALYPYITELSVPQRKLLTIYIERKISKKDGVK